MTDNASQEATNLLEQIKVIKNSAEEAARSLDEKNIQAKNILNEAIQKQKQIGEEHDQLKGEVNLLRQEEKGLQSALEEIKRLKTEAEKVKDSVQADVQIISQTKDEFEALKNQNTSAINDLKNRQAEVVSKISEIKGAYDRVIQQQGVLFEDKQDGEDKVIKGIVNQIHEANTNIKGMLDETKRNTDEAKQGLETLKQETATTLEEIISKSEKDLSESLQQASIETKKLWDNLNSEIKSLLPGAGAAGLAYAYMDAKSKYAPTKFEYGGKTGEDWFVRWPKLVISWLWHGIKCFTVPAIFYAMFLIPLVLIVYYFYDLMDFAKTHPKEFDKELWIFRGVLSLPLAVISFFGWSSIKLYRRLYEEYNHKQRVMQLYHSFKKEIEEYGGDEHKKALLAVMLKAVEDKPSLDMHKYDKGIEEMWPNFTLGSFFSNMVKKDGQ